MKTKHNLFSDRLDKKAFEISEKLIKRSGYSAGVFRIKTIIDKKYRKDKDHSQRLTNILQTLDKKTKESSSFKNEVHVFLNELQSTHQKISIFFDRLINILKMKKDVVEFIELALNGESDVENNNYPKEAFNIFEELKSFISSKKMGKFLLHDLIRDYKADSNFSKIDTIQDKDVEISLRNDI